MERTLGYVLSAAKKVLTVFSLSFLQGAGFMLGAIAFLGVAHAINPSIPNPTQVLSYVETFLH